MVLYAFPVVAAAAAAVAGPIVIDDFADGAFSQSISSDNIVGQDAATVLGDQRDYALIVNGNDFAQSYDASVIPGVGLFVSGGVGLDGTFWLQYDGDEDVEDGTLPFNSDGGLVIDLTPFNAFEIDFITLDLDMVIEAHVINVDDDGIVTDLSVATADVTAGDNFTQSISFDDFVGTADFSNAAGILFGFNTSDADSPNRDFAISSITVVPAPGTLALIGLGTLVMRRRR